MSDYLRLNLGGGDSPLPGYVTIDRRAGSEAYPLAYPDDSVSDIYASHVLEHFGHEVVRKVLADWVRALKPGGRLRLSVPDFQWLARKYLAGHQMPVQGYVMGGHSDANDHHGAIFDEAALADAMAAAGLIHIATWKPEDVAPDWRGKDCASMELSLNLEGIKPGPGAGDIKDVFAVLSAPRFAPVMHARCAFIAMQELTIPYCVGHGAYWHQVLTNLIEDSEAGLRARGMNPKWVLTFDYDTIFEPCQIRELYRLAHQREDVDAVTCLQMKRSSQSALFSVAGEDGVLQSQIAASHFDRDLLRIHTGHFGMTLIKLSSLQKLPRPWLRDAPDADGRWKPEGKIDADVAFWLGWRKAGLKLYLAPKVRVGHIQEVVTWPTLIDTPDGHKALSAVHLTLDEFDESGTPPLQ